MESEGLRYLVTFSPMADLGLLLLIPPSSLLLPFTAADCERRISPSPPAGAADAAWFLLKGDDDDA